jgi:hypothetical protein
MSLHRHLRPDFPDSPLGETQSPLVSAHLRPLPIQVFRRTKPARHT